VSGPSLRLVRVLGVVVALGLVAAPLALALLLGLHHRRLPGDVGAGSGIVMVLALVYVVWLPLVVYGLVWVLDRLGIHYTSPERQRVSTPRQRRRTLAGLRFLSGRPTLGQGGSPRADGRRRRDGGQAQKRPPSNGGR
jgi:hypothetical protein